MTILIWKKVGSSECEVTLKNRHLTGGFGMVVGFLLTNKEYLDVPIREAVEVLMDECWAYIEETTVAQYVARCRSMENNGEFGEPNEPMHHIVEDRQGNRTCTPPLIIRNTGTLADLAVTEYKGLTS